MTILEMINSVFATMILGAVMFRCIRSAPYGTDMRSKLIWHTWITAHIMIGAGCFGYVCAQFVDIEPRASISLLFLGMSLLLVIRWHRRKGET